MRHFNTVAFLVLLLLGLAFGFAGVSGMRAQERPAIEFGTDWGSIEAGSAADTATCNLLRGHERDPCEAAADIRRRIFLFPLPADRPRVQDALPPSIPDQPFGSAQDASAPSG